jgi:hypothetical protein
MTITPGDVHLLPPGVNSAAALRECLAFEQLAADMQAHELFIVWHRGDPANQFAVIFRVLKSRLRAWPLLIDRDSRVVEIRPAVQDKPPADPPRKHWPAPEVSRDV